MQYQVLTKQRHLACSLHPFPQLKTLGKSAEVRENVIADARFNTRFFAIYYYLAVTATGAPSPAAAGSSSQATTHGSNKP